MSDSDNNPDNNFEVEKYPATLISNQIIQTLTNAESLGVYVFIKLAAQEEYISPRHVAEHFNMSEQKSVQLLNFLMDKKIIRKGVSE